MNVYCYPDDIADELKQSDCSSSQSSLVLDSPSCGIVPDSPLSVTGDSDDSSAVESFDDVEDFCIIDEPGLGIMVSSDQMCSVCITSFQCFDQI